MVEEGLHERCLPAAGSAADDAVLPLSDQCYDRIPNVGRHTARSDEFIRAVPSVEFADSHGDSVDRSRRSDDGNARTVWKAGVKNGILIGEILTELPGDL